MTKTSTFTWGEISEILELTIKTAIISEVIGVGFSYLYSCCFVYLFVSLFFVFIFISEFKKLSSFYRHGQI